MARGQSQTRSDSSANLGFEAKLWLAADKLRNNMDAAEYKHVVFGLIFLKCISDTFEEHRAKLVAGKGEDKGANPGDPDEYKAENVFWVQHFIHHLGPRGMGGFVPANGSTSSNQSGECDIRRALIEADRVDCMVAVHAQLFGKIVMN